MCYEYVVWYIGFETILYDEVFEHPLSWIMSLDLFQLDENPDSKFVI